MKVEIRLFATLKELLPTRNSEGTIIEVNRGTIIDDLVEKYKIPREIRLIIIVNGRHEDESYIINDGDRIGIFPPVGGG
ncbi:MAG: MoaD/ThiS family protein [Bacillota bacterium]|nr:MoaD/ThiS family protein [Bacillota bacterium]